MGTGSGTGTPITSFDSAITVTLVYTDTETTGVLEETLGLYYWESDTSAWKDVVTTCPDGEYYRYPEEGTLIAPLCHLSEFGLFGSPRYTFLPLIGLRHFFFIGGSHPEPLESALMLGIPAWTFMLGVLFISAILAIEFVKTIQGARHG